MLGPLEKNQKPLRTIVVQCLCRPAPLSAGAVISLPRIPSALARPTPHHISSAARRRPHSFVSVVAIAFGIPLALVRSVALYPSSAARCRLPSPVNVVIDVFNRPSPPYPSRLRHPRASSSPSRLPPPPSAHGLRPLLCAGHSWRCRTSPASPPPSLSPQPRPPLPSSPPSRP